jgi:hypothetical protein
MEGDESEHAAHPLDRSPGSRALAQTGDRDEGLVGSGAPFLFRAE